MLEANYSTSLTGALATFYGNLLLSTSPNTLAQLTGEVSTAPQNASFGVFGQFLGTVFGQTATSRADGQAVADGGSHVACAQRHDRRRHAQGAGLHRGMQLSDYCDTTRGGSPPGRRASAASAASTATPAPAPPGSISTRRGGALGVDMQVTPNLIAGVTMGTTSAGFGLTDIASSGSARSILLGLYGGYTQGPLYVDAALAYGYNSFNTTRVDQHRLDVGGRHTGPSTAISMAAGSRAAGASPSTSTR